VAAESEIMMVQEANPPRWAESILGLVLKPADRETVSGDLLEEYRDTKRPELGRTRADAWYIRHVLGYFWRSVWPCVVLLALMFATHDLYNSFLNTGSATNALLERVFTGAALTAWVLVGIYGGRRTGRVSGGTLMTAGAQASAWLFMAVWWAFTTYPFAQLMQANPYWIAAWHYRPTDASFERWLIEDNIGAFLFGGSAGLVAALVLGSIGGAAGRFLRPPTRGAARAF
jgi:hypothetical protein